MPGTHPIHLLWPGEHDWWCFGRQGSSPRNSARNEELGGEGWCLPRERHAGLCVEKSPTAPCPGSRALFRACYPAALATVANGAANTLALVVAPDGPAHAPCPPAPMITTIVMPAAMSAIVVAPGIVTLAVVPILASMATLGRGGRCCDTHGAKRDRRRHEHFHNTHVVTPLFAPCRGATNGATAYVHRGQSDARYDREERGNRDPLSTHCGHYLRLEATVARSAILWKPRGER